MVTATFTVDRWTLCVLLDSQTLSGLWCYHGRWRLEMRLKAVQGMVVWLLTRDKTQTKTK